MLAFVVNHTFEFIRISSAIPASVCETAILLVTLSPVLEPSADSNWQPRFANQLKSAIIKLASAYSSVIHPSAIG